jgi:hypothetical protein
MIAAIFAGPSIRGLDLPRRTDIVFHPPAMQGDIFRATLAHPKVIGLIDGYFEGVPSVWHKEILWALSQGISVFGSASMGALRAAELDSFGMIGVGRIYQWYRDGVLEDDDEVALVHGPSDSGFLPLSEPMVNVRSTCEAAVAARIIDRQSAKDIISAAKLLHYRQRSWKSVLAAAQTHCPPLDEFARWLPTGGVDQKRLDAGALIADVVSCLDQPQKSRNPDFRFEWTDLWDRAVQEWETSEPAAEGFGAVSVSAILDELRLEPERYAACRSKALQRAVLLREADRRGLAAAPGGKRQILARLREGLGLMRKADLDEWIKENGLTAAEFEALIDDEARVESVARISSRSIEHHILNLLRTSGEYQPAAFRAQAKQRILEQLGFSSTEPPQDPSPPLLIGWYFNKLRQNIPDDIDSFIENIGLSDRQSFYRLLAAEYVYCCKKEEGGQSSDH